MKPFISEDDLDSFEGWRRYQGFESATPGQLADLRQHYDEMRARVSTIPKIGRIKFRPGESRWAVAIRDGDDLWLTLWVTRSPKGEFFVLRPPLGLPDWEPHTSYHRDGALHMKSYDQKVIVQQRQPLTGVFRGAEHLGLHAGHSPKKLGAICDPKDFDGIVVVAPGILGPTQGAVLVDLVEPGCDPISHPSRTVQQQVFCDTVPWVVIRICQ